MQQLLSSLQQFHSKDGWVLALIRLLGQKTHALKKQTENVHVDEDDQCKKSNSEPLYKFSALSETRAVSLIKKLKALNQEKKTNPWINYARSYQSDGLVEGNKEMSAEVVLSGSQPNPVEFETPEKKVLTFTDTDTPTFLSAKRRRMSAEDDTEANKSEEEEIDTTEKSTLDHDYILQAERLKEVWSSGGDISEIQSELDIFKTCTAEQIQAVCNVLNFKSLEEVALVTACHHLTSLGTEVSYSNCVCFARSALMPKIISLNQNPSRHFIGAVVTFAKVFPKQVVEAAIIPVLTVQAGKYQAVLVSKVVKEAIPSEHQQLLLKQVIRSQVECSEDVFTVLQTILECQPNFDDELLRDLSSYLAQYAVSLANSLKYGKLILALINKYGKQLNPDERVVVSQILKVHNTFLKKSAEASLKRLG
ncbi:uncharacterized protein LOC106163841 [Lingula anatina]|uniref:Uncharacterized protein LOC106163841 n=1 Tax=Lingula anatina TaxID=7574 RepID=A0A1S3IFR5_LINAN|nr:uncharacterized protein LOC106163841 [Lingula anatina]|eukprot:XP_013396988.1 uncharacterized protein LOC106163841 [Lingula anatina]